MLAPRLGEIPTEPSAISWVFVPFQGGRTILTGSAINFPLTGASEVLRTGVQPRMKI